MLQVPHFLAGQGQAAGLIPPGSTTFHLLLAIHSPPPLAGPPGVAGGAGSAGAGSGCTSPA
jgi:hypothetical protein